MKCSWVLFLCKISLFAPKTHQSAPSAGRRQCSTIYIERCVALVGRPSCILFSLTHSKDILTAELPLDGCIRSNVHVFATLPSARPSPHRALHCCARSLMHGPSLPCARTRHRSWTDACGYHASWCLQVTLHASSLLAAGRSCYREMQMEAYRPGVQSMEQQSVPDLTHTLAKWPA